MTEGVPKPIIVFDVDNTIILRADGTGSEEVKGGAWYGVYPECPPEEFRVLIDEVQEKIKGGKGDRRDIARRVARYMEFLMI